MNKTPRFTAVFAVLLALNAPVGAWAKVSVSVILCFEPNVRVISPGAAGHLDRFAERSRATGEPVGLFATTVGDADLEVPAASAARIDDLVAALVGRGIRFPATHADRIEASASDMGCPAHQLAIELEALFPHDGYR
ncbi:hypothetical protein LRH25_27745 [Ideonella azotifigens]|uniref:Uncharacterized protein n=1 Tax=Ideonella azotifigens TaxID=513160 RepID=A0ABN1KBV1_9BURK|nr:hypothetical protein [Ideonella azotifigens]MCD2344123.1 hypothetical protein [Ideonella azotifigens]